jgi:mRNA interferase MazF
MTGFEFGAIVLVPFPFTDQSQLKQRPAVIVSSRAYQQQRPDVIVMAVTSQVRPKPGIGEVLLQDWQGAGLLKASVIKPVFATLAQSLIIKSLGQLHSADQRALKQAIAQVLG